jgi:PRTRC genetic system ThiF family protein
MMRETTQAKAGAFLHRLPNAFLTKHVRITVVGCGGTGGAVAMGLPYLHQSMLAWGHPYGLDVTLIDGDRVSPNNCVRQPFGQSDIGLHKATVLVNRINMFWGLQWKAAPQFLDESWGQETDILIGCVDSRNSRMMMKQSKAHRNCLYMLDIGNNSDTGQFILGQPQNSRNKKNPTRLRTAAELFPELIDSTLDEKDTLPSCNALESLTRQEPFVNQTLANQALALLARLFHHGALSHHGCFLNLSRGSMTPLLVDPQTWKRIMQTNKRKF